MSHVALVSQPDRVPAVVDHVQITMAADIGTGGRAGYYDGVGAARTVIQGHHFP